jgi:hypothetical protein
MDRIERIIKGKHRGSVKAAQEKLSAANKGERKVSPI